MMGRVILPWFGGSSAVWSTTLLFFPSLVTAGYAYAYGLLGRLRPRVQSTLHLAGLAISLLLLALTALRWGSPLTPDASWRLQPGAAPILGILTLLGVSVGLPYLLLAANSTLMQGWFQREPGGRTPYRLYALSNAGSLAGLLSYPLLVEPLLTLRTQAWCGSGGLPAVRAWRRSDQPAGGTRRTAGCGR
jgi:hypothetical protein